MLIQSLCRPCLMVVLTIALADAGTIPLTVQAVGEQQGLSTDSEFIAQMLSWKRSDVWTGSQFGPTDAAGRAWHHPLFDDSEWGAVSLPDSDLNSAANDRYYRVHFEWDGTSFVLIYFKSDDGLAVHINGHLFGEWGKGWRQSGCINYPPTCANAEEVYWQTLPESKLQKGDNVIAIDLWNATTCCFTYLDVTVAFLNSDQTLIEKYAPQLFFHPDDVYRPIAIDLPVIYSQLRHADDRPPLRSPTPDDLFPSSPWNTKDTFMDLLGDGPEGLRNIYQSVVGPQSPKVAYARVYRDGERRQIAVQYWFFYYDNPWCNHHEGDWEMIQVVLHENDQNDPRYVVYSQHGGGTKRLWQYVEQADQHPKVFVAQGSHANYFKPYNHFAFCFDRTSQSSEPLTPSAQLLPEDTRTHWVEFMGHWGSRGKGWLQYPSLRDEDGPTGPSQKHSAWASPISWADGIGWDEEALHHLGKLWVGAPMPLDIEVIERPSGRRVGWRAGDPEIGVPTAEYFDNALSGRRTVIVHQPAPGSRFEVNYRLRHAVTTQATQATPPLTVNLRFPDLQSGQVISAAYTITETWSMSTTATIIIAPDSDRHLQIDQNGDGVFDQQIAPGSATQSPYDSTPPAATPDLSATAMPDQNVRLTWTAPGDDGLAGRAIAYDLRYSTAPITANNWVRATSVISPPWPSQAGMQESFTISNLLGGTYYFAIRAVDDVFQFSELSNVTQATVSYRIHVPIVQR